MADTYARMLQLIGTETDWQFNDLVLQYGEIALTVESDGVRAKVGDGTSLFSQLDYLAGGGLPTTGGTMTGPITFAHPTASGGDYIVAGEAYPGIPQANVLYIRPDGNAASGSGVVLRTQDDTGNGFTQHDFIFNISGELKLPVLSDTYAYPTDAAVPRSWIENNPRFLGVATISRSSASGLAISDLDTPDDNAFLWVDQGSLRLSQVGSVDGDPPYPPGNSWMECDVNGATRLYHNGIEVLTTKSNGKIANGSGVEYALVSEAMTLNTQQTVTGAKTFTQDVRTQGVLVSQRSGSGGIAFGDTDILTENALMWIDNGNVRLSAVGDISGSPPYPPGDSFLEIDRDGATRLYFNGQLAAQTLSGGRLGNASGVEYATVSAMQSLIDSLEARIATLEAG